MYIYIYIYNHIHIHLHIHFHIRIHIHIHNIFVCVCILLNIYVSSCIVHMHACVRIFVYTICYRSKSKYCKSGHNSPGCGRPTPVSDVFWTSTTIFNLGANQLLCCSWCLSVRDDSVGDMNSRAFVL